MYIQTHRISPRTIICKKKTNKQIDQTNTERILLAIVDRIEKPFADRCGKKNLNLKD
jgi:hypothetical protein